MVQNPLDYLIAHIFLPPKLPQADDTSSENEKTLLETLEHALTLFIELIPSHHRSRWSSCLKMVSNMRLMRKNDDPLDSAEIERIIKTLEDGDLIALHLRSQNAGIIIRRSHKEYIFECFELSPQNESVIPTKGRLVRCFPGPAIVVAGSRIHEENFLGPFVEMMGKLDLEAPAEVRPVVQKARSEVEEIRDTVHPKFVTQMMIQVLGAIGNRAKVSRIYKYTREDVLWKDTLQPWRRSPLWLLLRVALQLNVMDSNSDIRHIGYKIFMLFFMAHLLERGVQSCIRNETLFIMMAKISSRALKLGESQEQSWLQKVELNVNNAKELISRRWQVLEDDPNPLQVPELNCITESSCIANTSLKLENLSPYLEHIHARRADGLVDQKFEPKGTVRVRQNRSKLPAIAQSKSSSELDSYNGLLDYEIWVQDHLDNWQAANMGNPKSCEDLAGTFREYTSFALARCCNDPEHFSLMCLTAVELWIAIDKCATHHHPLLLDYSPEISPDIFEPLLLPKRKHLERLIKVEEYLKQRLESASLHNTSIFKKLATPTSLGVRFAQQSSPHQRLRTKIETHAEQEKSRKVASYNRQREVYDRLKMEASRMTCEYVDKWEKYRTISVHSSSCSKCDRETKAKDMKINVFEWPLPNTELDVQATIFELDVPSAIFEWREILYYLLTEVLCSERNGPRNIPSRESHTLRDYSGLLDFRRLHTGRLQASSKTKSFLNSHYRTKFISEANQNNVCVNNGLTYDLYDRDTRYYISEHMTKGDIRPQCTPKLQSGEYRQMQFAINDTIHNSNDVIAQQITCARELSLHEFYSFGALRAGHRLQWRNIARELATDVLDFYHEDVHRVILQAAWQAGKTFDASIWRDSHKDLSEEHFGQSLIFALNGSFAIVEGNWQGAVAARTFSALASRLLSLSDHESVHSKCLLFLQRIRRVSRSWMRGVARHLASTTDEERLQEISRRALEMALTCHLTFDVDGDYSSDTMSSFEDNSTLVECMITVHDRCPVDIHTLPDSLKALIFRSRRLSHRIEPCLKDLLLLDSNGLYASVRSVWPGYLLGALWSELPGSMHREWLTTLNRNVAGNMLSVHFNVISGSLLFNGKPLTRLPPSYESHNTFRRILGRRVVEIVPSTMLGMVFESRDDYFLHKLHFRMENDDLIIQASKEGKMWELIPEHKLGDDFPTRLREDYVHWLDLSNMSIEFRPLSNPFISAESHWIMRKEKGDVYNLSKDSKKLIDRHSRTASLLSHIFMPLAPTQYVHVILNTADRRLEVHLPCLKLDFFVSHGEKRLQSRQFQGLFVDPNQSVGTLTGLTNKLVLRNENGFRRSIVIPYGVVAFHKTDSHVQVEISTNERDISYHLYQVDKRLERIVDDGSLKSKLFICYLHALTSSCIPDRLTKHTGTEQALSILTSPATRSFQTLSDDEMEILRLVFRLAPRRSFYPEHLEVMQKVVWQTLSPLSQHPLFAIYAQNLVDQSERFANAFDLSPSLIEFRSGKGHFYLSRRALIRDSTFYVSGFGADYHTSDEDVRYIARDYLRESARETFVREIALSVDQWSPQACCSNLLETIKTWGSITGFQGELVPLGYDLRWLGPWSSFMPAEFFTIQATLSRCRKDDDRYRIMVFLATLAYSEYAQPAFIHSLLAFATSDELRSKKVPQEYLYQLHDGFAPSEYDLTTTVEANLRSFGLSAESELSPLLGEDGDSAYARRRLLFETACQGIVKNFVTDLLSQWPKPDVLSPSEDLFGTYISVSAAMQVIRAKFESCFRNLMLKEYLSSVQQTLNGFQETHPPLIRHKPEKVAYVYSSTSCHVSSGDLFQRPAPDLDSYHEELEQHIGVSASAPDDHERILKLLHRIQEQALTGHENVYVSDLAKSVEALGKGGKSVWRASRQDTTSILETNLDRCERHLKCVHEKISLALSDEPCTLRRLSCLAYVRPRFSVCVLLRKFSESGQADMPEHWKECLVKYALALAAARRAQRLCRFAGNHEEFMTELLSGIKCDWDRLTYPGWLTFEIENDISIRPIQCLVAKEIMSPSSNSNSVLQLNMGEGKSSVIVPMVAWAMADSERLVRIVILKPIAPQMLHLLVQKLSGFLGRRIYQMPISRSIRMDVEKARAFEVIFKECKNNRGILLMHPEHIQSFELMCIEHVLSGSAELRSILTGVQSWLDQNSRDILDESDEILSVRSELVYTMGAQRPIDFFPHRWLLVQNMLHLLHECALHCLKDCPQGLEYDEKHRGNFPHIRVVQPCAEQALLRTLTDKICTFGLPGLAVGNFSSELRSNIHEYLLDPQIHVDRVRWLENAVEDGVIWKSLLLLRGLISGGIISFALRKKRWRVNYGLDLTRSMLAVPYDAKDCPSLRSEFSHPDATIVLTCLSYYYGGLTNDQLRVAFEKLLACDNAEEEFQLWVKDADNLPPPLCQLSSINLLDIGQFTDDIFPSFRLAKGAIDFHLAQTVFPIEMREFTHRLSSSGWDLARKKKHLTTGFSGTNDSRYILPLSINQGDLASQLSTNALVLKWILQPENCYQQVLTSSSQTKMLDAQTLLHTVLKSEPRIRVIIDVGAQVLEWKNEELARRWLRSTPDGEAQAVVFFNDDNELAVLSRDDTVQAYTISPYTGRMDQCLVYLDEAHTRGTDLKLPTNYRALVTLGPSLTKDRLTQACMRMRKLGRGQSVVFCGPQEVEWGIRQVNAKEEPATIEVIDVLRWTISQTCTNMRELVPLWAVQGWRCQKRGPIWSEVLTNTDEAFIKTKAEELLEDEAQTLEQRYGPNNTTSEERMLLKSHVDETSRLPCDQIDRIRSKCIDFEVQTFRSAALSEEQERELAPEIQQEREVQRPPAVDPLKPYVHPDVRSFISTGTLLSNSVAFLPAFTIFEQTSAHTYLDINSWPSDLLVTAEFAKTVHLCKGDLTDAYLAPVHWIARSGTHLVVLSPFEAQELLPAIRQHKKCTLHVYAAKSKAAMPHPLDDLTFCPVPGPTPPFHLTQLLNLFAGQLYLSSHAAYLDLCHFLGIITHPPPPGINIALDGFVPPHLRVRVICLMTAAGSECPFRKSPIPFLRAAMELRRKGDVFRRSHVGRILRGEVLTVEDFEEG